MAKETYPQAFLCPISHELMRDPVIASDGYTYEHREILKWLSKNRTSPMTRQPISPTLTP